MPPEGITENLGKKYRLTLKGIFIVPGRLITSLVEIKDEGADIPLYL